MKLKSFGCSFVFGTDLPNDGRYNVIATPSDYAWPALMAKRLGLQFECHARPGAGNFEICQRIIGEAAKDTADVYIINWSWIDRFSFIDETGRHRHPLNPLSWSSIMPVDQDHLGIFYYKNLHTQLRDKMETLTAIKTAIDVCKQTHNQFIMTWTDALIWETQWHAPLCVTWLQDQIRPHLDDFDGLSFLDWSRQNGFDISETCHPLVDAHQAAADLWMPKIERIINTTR